MDIALERGAGRERRTVYRQISDHIRLEVADGRLEAGDRLPPIRNLAKDLGVNRDTVALAYEELLRMGLVKVGSSIFVLRPDGYYEPAAVDGAVLPGTIRDLGIDFLMPTRIVGARGGVIEFDAKDLLKTHGRSASAVVGTVTRTIWQPAFTRRSI